MANHLPYDVLSRLAERRATPVEEAKAQRHLDRCGRCRSELAWLERIRSLPERGIMADAFDPRPIDLRRPERDDQPPWSAFGDRRRGPARAATISTSPSTGAVAADWMVRPIAPRG